ncbi:hypothetical protein [Formosa sp. A9]|uniref:hypothetical protein n=1 Tax=Formosa sp. A9 TaxID=3442641 RepID=UPI003EB8B508
MAIRLSNNCDHCANMEAGHTCAVHHVKVNKDYTCDSFDMKLALKDDTSCATCLRFSTTSCPNPTKAAPDMLCSHWGPKNIA